jgi:tetratricopeptide (TPR) repeat protein
MKKSLLYMGLFVCVGMSTKVRATEENRLSAIELRRGFAAMFLHFGDRYYISDIDQAYRQAAKWYWRAAHQDVDQDLKSRAFLRLAHIAHEGGRGVAKDWNLARQLLSVTLQTATDNAIKREAYLLSGGMYARGDETLPQDLDGAYQSFNNVVSLGFLGDEFHRISCATGFYNIGLAYAQIGAIDQARTCFHRVQDLAAQGGSDLITQLIFQSLTEHANEQCALLPLDPSYAGG